MSEIRALIVRVATENRSWGYSRIQGAVANLNQEFSRGTIATVLREHGLEPAPDRLKKTTWSEFLKAQCVLRQYSDRRATTLTIRFRAKETQDCRWSTRAGK